MMLHLDPAKADVDAWRALAARAVEPNPFFEPELLLPALARLGDEGVRLLVARDAGGAWTGLLPVRRAAQWRRMPTSSQGTWMHPYCFFGAPLLAAGSEADAMAVLLDGVRDRASLAPLEYLPADGPVADAVRGALTATGVRAVVWDEHERAALRRRPRDDYVESVLSARRRRELRRQRKHLERELGATVECLDASEDPGAVDAFLALEASGWKGRAGTAMGTGEAGAFFREACAAFRAAGRLQLLLLHADDCVIAAKCNLVAGDGVFCFKIAYAETLARYSPGVQLELDHVHAFHGRPKLAWADSCADPANPMIHRLWPDRRRLTTLLVPGSGARGRVGRVQAGIVAGVRNSKKGAKRLTSDLEGPGTIPNLKARSGTTDMSGLLTIDRDTFGEGYARKPFRVSHKLTQHPLLSLDSLGELADFLPGHRVEHNRADVPEILPSGEAEKLDATPGEIARGIQTNGAWMVLKHIESHPKYSALLDEALDEVMPFVAEREGVMHHRVGFIFLTSPGGTTPAHTDPEHNFLLQVHGWKEMTVGLWPTKLDQQRELESQVAPGGHRNVPAMPAGAETFRLDPGDGIYVPIHAPHLVKNGDQVSISLSITWQTPVSERELLATSLNARLRRLKLSPRPPGDRPLGDKAKAAAMRALHKARGSEFN